MSKELIEQLRDLANCRHDDLSIGYEAADRIEQLEREVAVLKTTPAHLRHDLHCVVEPAVNGADIVVQVTPPLSERNTFGRREAVGTENAPVPQAQIVSPRTATSVICTLKSVNIGSMVTPRSAEK